VIVLFIVTALVFILMHLLPGDPILYYLTQDRFTQATPEELADLRHQFGVDRPIVVQYFDWLNDIFHGDLGRSVSRRVPVNELIKQALPISFYLGGLSFIISNAIAIPIGIISAARRGKWSDTILTVLANIGITAPTFWVGVILIYLFGITLGWLPTHGYTSPFEDFWRSTRQIIMPIICLSVFPLAGAVRQTRSAMLEVIHQDYIRTAWSKGLTERTVILKHAVKNGIIPVVTLVGMGIGSIVGGQVLVEQVFTIPGMGRLAVDALFARDYAVVQGIVLIIAVVVLLSNLAVDISYGWLDPRVRYD
jgi:peptide/nickel transport system permease protein